MGAVADGGRMESVGLNADVSPAPFELTFWIPANAVAHLLELASSLGASFADGSAGSQDHRDSRLRTGIQPNCAQSLETPLSPREREVLDLVRIGMVDNAIARRLGISAHTVRTHLRRSFTKLGAGNRAEAVARLLPFPMGPDDASDNGVVTVPSVVSATVRRIPPDG